MLIKKDIHLRNLAIIVLLWIVGALPYEYLIIKNIMQTGDVAGTLASALFGARWQAAVLNTSLSVKIVKENFLFILYNFPTPNILLFFVGCWGLFKISPSPGIRYVLLGLMILFFIFAFRYTVPDRYAFFIPFYCMASVFIGRGAYFLQAQINSKVFSYLVLIFSLLSVGVYVAAPTWAEKMQLNLGTRSDIPYRNDYKYFLQPWKTGYKAAEHFADEALDVAESDAVIFADSTTVAPLLLVQQVEGKRGDVKIVSGIVSSKNAPSFNAHTIEQLLKSRSVYVVSRQAEYCPSFVLNNYDLVPAGLLWQVVKKHE